MEGTPHPFSTEGARGFPSYKLLIGVLYESFMYVCTYQLLISYKSYKSYKSQMTPPPSWVYMLCATHGLTNSKTAALSGDSRQPSP